MHTIQIVGKETLLTRFGSLLRQRPSEIFGMVGPWGAHNRSSVDESVTRRRMKLKFISETAKKAERLGGGIEQAYTRGY